MDTSSNPIEAVRARLDGGRKWIKGEMHRGGNSCLMGALTDECHQQQIDRMPLYRILQGVVAEQFPERGTYDKPNPPIVEPAKFNDHPDTTWPDVDLVLDKAARAWDEQVRP